MNKELIKKYKEEFDHWLNGGKLTYKFKDNRQFYNITWDEPIEELDYIIINDKYVEFRKALAEGKTVQYRQNRDVDFSDIPLSLNQCIVAYPHFGPDRYRIKPEEPQFKVGDWLRVKKNGSIFSLKPLHLEKGLFYYNNGLELNEYLEESEVIKWEPQVGELCWFGSSGISNHAVLSNFHSYGKSNLFRDTHSSYNYCEPFLNSKPSWFKD